MPNAMSVPKVDPARRGVERSRSQEQIERFTAEALQHELQALQLRALARSVGENEVQREGESRTRRIARFRKSLVRAQLAEVRFALTGEHRASNATAYLKYRFFELVYQRCRDAGNPAQGVEMAQPWIAKKLDCSERHVRRLLREVSPFVESTDCGNHPNGYRVRLPHNPETLDLLREIQALENEAAAEVQGLICEDICEDIPVRA